MLRPCCVLSPSFAWPAWPTRLRPRSIASRQPALSPLPTAMAHRRFRSNPAMAIRKATRWNCASTWRRPSASRSPRRHSKSNGVRSMRQTRLDAVASGKADAECGTTTITLGRMRARRFHACRSSSTAAACWCAPRHHLARLADLEGAQDRGDRRHHHVTCAAAALSSVVDVGVDARPGQGRRRGRCAAALRQGRRLRRRPRGAGRARKRATAWRELEFIGSDFSFEPYALMRSPRRSGFPPRGQSRAGRHVQERRHRCRSSCDGSAPLGRPGPLLNAMFYLNMPSRMRLPHIRRLRSRWRPALACAPATWAQGHRRQDCGTLRRHTEDRAVKIASSGRRWARCNDPAASAADSPVSRAKPRRSFRSAAASRTTAWSSLGAAGGAAYAQKPNEYQQTRWDVTVQHGQRSAPRVITARYEPVFQRRRPRARIRQPARAARALT